MRKRLKHSCLFCGKRFSSSNDLKIHVQNHNDLTEKEKKEYFDDQEKAKRKTKVRTKTSSSKPSQKIKNSTRKIKLRDETLEEYKTLYIKQCKELGEVNENLEKKIMKAKNAKQLRKIVNSNMGNYIKETRKNKKLISTPMGGQGKFKRK